MRDPQYAVITGASRGLGAAFARALAVRNLNLVLVARSKDRLDCLAKELETRCSIHAIPLELDLTCVEAGRQLAAELRHRGLEINLLVNNAGFGARGAFAELPLDRQIEMIRLNCQSVLDVTFHLLPMLREHRGSIINVASTAGFQPIPYAAVYAATKSCLIAFSLGVEQELRPCGVRVTTLCPGRIRARSASKAENWRHEFSAIFQTPDEVVESALDALDRGGGLVVPGSVNKLSIFVQRAIPRRAVARIMSWLSRL